MNRSLRSEIASIFSFLRAGEVDLGFFSLTVLLSVLHGFIHLCIFSLLFPLLDGIIKNDFTAVRSLRFIGPLIQRAPEAWQTQSSLFMGLVAWIYSLMLIKNAVSYLTGLCVGYQGMIAARKIRQLVFDRVLSFGRPYFDGNNGPALNHIIATSASWVEGQLRIFHVLLTQCLSLGVFLSLMFSTSWRLTLVVLTILPAVHCLTGLLTRRIRAASIENSAALESLHSRIGDMLGGIHLVKGYNRQAKEKEDFLRVSDLEIQSSFRKQKLSRIVEPIQDICHTSGLLLVAGAISWIGRSGGIEASAIFGIVYLTIKVIPTFNALSEFRSSMAEIAGPIGQIEHLMADGDKFFMEDGGRPFEGVHERIEFDQLDFSYRNGVPILRGVTFSIEKGKTTALVGPSGSGKTTIAHLLLRFYDAPPGTLRIDGTDIRNFSVESLRSKMSFVSQDAFLFNGTLRFNLTYAAHSPVSEERLWEVIRVARLSQLVGDLPEGLETHVGERGTKLSGGEKQRVAIARALLRESEILIFDEPTSALDSRTESLISAAMKELAKGRTLLVIAHRLSTIQRADHIIVIEGGRAVEAGNFEGLLQHGSAFRRLWSAQGLRSVGPAPVTYA